MNETLDPRRERLIALLYGELDEESARALHAEIEADPALCADWEDLQAARATLTDLAEEEAAPGFVFLAPEPTASSASGGSVWSRLAEWFRTPLAAPAWGAAAAVLLVAVLALGGFRVQQVPGGFALGFGDDLAAPPGRSDYARTQAPTATDGVADLGISDPGGTTSLGDVQATPVSASYVTRDDLQTYESQMFQLVKAMFKDYEDYRDQELAGIVRMLYADMNQRRTQDYGDLRDRIEAVNVGLLLEQNEDEARYRRLLDGGEPETLDLRSTPAEPEQRENDR